MSSSKTIVTEGQLIVINLHPSFYYNPVEDDHVDPLYYNELPQAVQKECSGLFQISTIHQ